MVKSNLKSTKFWLAVGTMAIVLAFATLLLWHNRITGEQWVDITKWVSVASLSVYGFANVLVKGIAAYRGVKEQK